MVVSAKVEAENEPAGGARLIGPRTVSTIIREVSEGSPWTKCLWALAIVIGIVDAYRWHHGAGFGFDTQHVWQAGHAILHGGSSWNQFVYPPGCLLLTFPLAALPFKGTEVIIYALQLLGIAYTFWAMTRLTKVSLGSARVAWLAVLLTLTGQLGIAAHYENFTLLLVPLAAAFFLAIGRDRPMAAAVILGLSLTIKPLLIPLLLVLLLARRFRETAVAVLIPVGLSAIAVVIIAALNANLSGFVHEVGHTFSGNSSIPWNMTLSAMGKHLHVPVGLSILARVLVVAVSLFANFRIWQRPRRDAGEQAVWLTAPLFVIIILCFSFAWAYYALLLVPLGFISLKQDRVADWIIRAGVFLALAPPILVYTIPGYPGRYYHATGNGIFHLGILLNGATVVGVLLTLIGLVLHASQGEQHQGEVDSDLGSSTTRSPVAA